MMRMESFRNAGMLTVWPTHECLLVQNRLNGQAVDIDATPATTHITGAPTSWQLRHPARISIGTSTRRRTAQSPRGGKSTTLTVTPPTTTRRTSSPSVLRSTGHSMKQGLMGCGLSAMNAESHLSPSGRGRVGAPPRARNANGGGSASPIKSRWLGLGPNNGHATTAETPLRRSDLGRGFAAARASSVRCASSGRAQSPTDDLVTAELDAAGVPG